MILNLKDRIWGVDVSKWQDDATTTKKPNLKMLADAGCKFVIARSTDGYVSKGKPTIDPLFHYFIEESLKYGMLVANYPYMNYWSHVANGMNSTQWGILQGQTVVEAIKPYGFIRTFMDLESSRFAPTKIEVVWGTAITIMDNEIKVIDDATGIDTGIYGSTGRLNMYHPYHRTRPLFAANYNPVSEEYINRIVLQGGWKNLLVIQANSTGDINNDSIPDGLRLGMENKAVDIDLWTADDQKFVEFFTGKTAQPTPPPVVTEPTDAEKLAKLWAWYKESHP